MSTKLLLGCSREHLAAMEPCSVDAIVTDPPYEIGFMGRSWDSTGIAYDPEFWRLCLNVLKPGGHLVSFGACRTYHRIACAIEDAGFEIRDSILAWGFGSGFPKSLDISKAIDKAAGAEREVVGTTRSPFRMSDPRIGNTLNSTQAGDTRQVDANGYIVREHTAPATPEAQQWDGWGSALKPAHEPIVLARKPLAGTIASTVLEYGTGGLNVRGCRVGDEVVTVNGNGNVWTEAGRKGEPHQPFSREGRWPPNVLLSPEAAAKLDAQTGTLTSGSRRAGNHGLVGYHGSEGEHPMPAIRGSKGGASRYFPVFDYGEQDRFFYAAKASRSEREAGCEHLPGKTQAETVDREPGAPGGNNPRAGAGRENGKGVGVKVRNFHPT